MLEWTDSAVFQQCTDMEKCYTYLVIKVKLLLDVECEIEVSTTPWCKWTLKWSLPSIKVLLFLAVRV